MMSDVAIGMEVLKDNAYEELQLLAGPENPQQAKLEAPESIRAIFGHDLQRNSVHVDDQQSMIDFFFNQGPHQNKRNCVTSAILSKCSLLLVKPHIIQSKLLGQMVDAVLTKGGFEISALQMFHLNKSTACEFFEVYKGVTPEFN